MCNALHVLNNDPNTEYSVLQYTTTTYYDLNYKQSRIISFLTTSIESENDIFMFLRKCSVTVYI